MKLSTFIALLVIPLWPQFTFSESPPASFAYVLQADSFAKTKSAAVERLTACGRDWIVLDAAFSSDTPWERTDLDAIRGGHAGSKVVAYISIGEAEDYRPYWRRSGEARADSPPPHPRGSMPRTRSGRGTIALSIGTPTGKSWYSPASMTR